MACHQHSIQGIGYQVSNRVQLVVTLANVVNECFGGQQTRFTYYSSAYLCTWTSTGGGLVNSVGNVYNPHDNVQTFLRYPYEPGFGAYNDNGDSTHQPMAIFASLRVKL